MKTTGMRSLGFLAGLAAIVLLLPLFAAFEAHVINVKAQIESRLVVSAPPTSFGSVFSHETFSTTFTVKLSDTVVRQSGFPVVRYQVLADLVPVPGTSPTTYYKDLAPFTYQQLDAGEHDGDTETTASLNWHIQDWEDRWLLQVYVPCIESAKCTDHGTPACSAFPCGGPDHTTCQTVPEDPPGSGSAGEYAVDVVVEITGMTDDDPGDMGSCTGCHQPDWMCITCHRADNLP